MDKPWQGVWMCLEEGLEGFMVITETHFTEVLQAQGRTPAAGDPPTESEAWDLLRTLHARAGTYTIRESVPDPNDPTKYKLTAVGRVVVCHDPGEVGKEYPVEMWIEGDTARERMVYPDKEGAIYSWRRVG